MADAVIDDKPVVYNLQNLVTARQGAYMDLLPVLLEKKVVICNEVGSGIVPVDRAERFAREATGRLCVELASQAEKVVRVCCGIPAVIKG
ncbi:bifunctional adenosylcobinamide kinase/adenosylcobinamide-phosphate guanylyltransferase [Oscillospiraceae bacterium CM]|nr:bifunctional adenosylcobinamide kinase/adenosylcobinamide-phosphate guanylyltransferase [Oscillospiraceae bacterium CM]